MPWINKVTIWKIYFISLKNQLYLPKKASPLLLDYNNLFKNIRKFLKKVIIITIQKLFLIFAKNNCFYKLKLLKLSYCFKQDYHS